MPTSVLNVKALVGAFSVIVKLLSSRRFVCSSSADTGPGARTGYAWQWRQVRPGAGQDTGHPPASSSSDPRSGLLGGFECSENVRNGTFTTQL